MSIGGHQSAAAESDTWLTPPEIIKALGDFDLDPCTPAVMPWRTAGQRYTEAEDGLRSPWFGRVWLNPPYSKEVERWMARMHAHKIGTALVFARTETEWWRDFVWRSASALLFFHGRLNFHYPEGNRAEHNAGGPSVLIAYGLEDADILAECRLDGAFVPLGCKGQSVMVLRHDDDEAMTWAELITALAERNGGSLNVQTAYGLVRNHPKARRNPNWQAKVRQQLQETMKRTGPAQYTLEAM